MVNAANDTLPKRIRTYSHVFETALRSEEVFLGKFGKYVMMFSINFSIDLHFFTHFFILQSHFLLSYLNKSLLACEVWR